MKNNKIYNDSTHGFVTMFWTGMHPSECTALRIGDVDLKNGFITVNKSRTLGEENVTKTTGSARIVRLLTHVAAVLRSSKELRVTEDDYFFKNRKRGRSTRIRGGKTTGTRRCAPRRSGAGFYCTRHTFMSLALTAGENIKAIAEHCGTSVPRIEKHYRKYMSSDFGARMMAEFDQPTEKN